jgi:hypothetical protein
MAIPTPEGWFAKLSDEAKRRLLDNPYGPVPDDLRAEVAEAGSVLVGAWFPGAQAGPDGVYLPREFRDYLEHTRLKIAVTRADERLYEFSKPGLATTPLPPKETLERHRIDPEAAAALTENLREAQSALTDFEQSHRP